MAGYATVAESHDDALHFEEPAIQATASFDQHRVRAPQQRAFSAFRVAALVSLVIYVGAWGLSFFMPPVTVPLNHLPRAESPAPS